VNRLVHIRSTTFPPTISKSIANPQSSTKPTRFCDDAERIGLFDKHRDRLGYQYPIAARNGLRVLPAPLRMTPRWVEVSDPRSHIMLLERPLSWRCSDFEDSHLLSYLVFLNISSAAMASEPEKHATAASNISDSDVEIVPGSINEKKLLRILDLRLLPAVSILYLLSFLDRSNGKRPASSMFRRVTDYSQLQMLVSKA
jgi:hypothetical protein